MSERPRESETKRFEQEYSDQIFLEVVSRLDLPTAKDVADEIGCAKTTAAGRLRTLEDRGELQSTAVGQAKVWQCE